MHTWMDSQKDIDEWLKVATAGLCDEAKARVRSEIESHYQDALDSLVQDGLTEKAVVRQAIEALGDPKAARKIFRSIHLTVFQYRIVKCLSVELDDAKQRSNRRGRILTGILIVAYVVANALLTAFGHWGGIEDALRMAPLVYSLCRFHPSTYNRFPPRAGLIFDMIYWPIFWTPILMWIDKLYLGSLTWNHTIAIWGFVQLITFWIEIPILLKLTGKELAHFESSSKEPDQYA